MLLFIVILIAIAALAQYYLTRDCLRDVREDYYPERNIAEPDEVFDLCVHLRNTGRHYLPFVRFSLYLTPEMQPVDLRHCSSGRYQDGVTFSRTTWLKPRQETEFRIPIKIAARGRYVLRPLNVYGGDFLGIREEVRSSSLFREVVIAPGESPREDITSVLGGFLGEQSVRRFIYEDPVLTAGFRGYTGQEPMKKISWTQSARGRGLMVKNDDYTAEPSVTVILNADRHDGGCAEDLEACCRMARTVCRTLEERRIPCALITNAVPAGGWYSGEEHGILRGSGSVHYQKILELLGRATDMINASDRTMLQRMIDRREHGGHILITSTDGMPDAALLEKLRALSDGSLLILTADAAPLP